MPKPWMIYGANGYTGELIAREAVRRGLKPWLAGRTAAKMQPLAANLDLQARVFDLRDVSVVRCFAARDGRLWLGCCFSLGDLALVHQSSSLDGLCFGPFALKQDGLTTSEVDVGRCQVL